MSSPETSPEVLKLRVLLKQAIEEIQGRLYLISKELEGITHVTEIKEKEAKVKTLIGIKRGLAQLPEGQNKYPGWNPPNEELDPRVLDFLKLINLSVWEITTKLLVVDSYIANSTQTQKIVALGRKLKEIHQNLREAFNEEPLTSGSSGLGPAEPEENEGLPELDSSAKVNYEDLEFGKQIGKGAFGTVWTALYFGTPVAVKVIPEQKEMMKFVQREVSLLKELRHPHIVQLIGICYHTDSILIVTEYVSGGNLHQYLKDLNFPLSWKIRIKVAKETAMAMAYLHSRSIIHRDLKCKNLLVDDPFKVKVCDFGLARALSPSEDGAVKHMTLCGTDDWMAPEVILGRPYSEKLMFLATVWSCVRLLQEEK
eukprot:TRINITY_DN2780_c0_g1_i1.p1 TRINITY_DN2780_c0_g1~~TRINITY_DN2780_c0_g1_i1.p1  ORF type:complete len:384 (+),score=96.91 TRINITY_DN2780_c0_g1_i1:47-1153(+)